MARQVREEFDIPLERRGNVIRVRFVREANTVIDFVVQYEAFINGQSRQIVRFDGSHGRPHRDILDWDGETMDKHWLPLGTTNNQALTEAIREIRTNWERYFDRFLRSRP